MQQWYPAIKHAHMLFITLSIILFNWRFWWRTRQPEQSLPKILKVLPHINDTLLLLSGGLMMHIFRWQLFGDYHWLGVKLALVLAYIALGVMCFRAVPRSNKWWFGYVIAMLTVVAVIYLARFKPI